MKKIKNSSINKKLKLLRKNIESMGRILATKKGTASLKRGLDITREDIDQKFRRLAVEIVKNSCDIKELKALYSPLEEVRENVWLMMGRLDAMAGKIEQLNE